VLAARGFVPDLALVSTAVRALETWEAAAPAFPLARLELSAELYNADPDVLFAAAEAADADSVMLVAHNPGMHQLVIDLAGRADALDRIGRGFATAAAAVFAFEGRRPRFLGGHDPDLIR
jgi:phosphohistidine phosphatase